MSTEKRPLKVFLCHASADKPRVRDLYRYLRKRGIKPWLDEENLFGGQDWQVEIPKAIASSDAIIVCLTRNSVDKEGYVQKEIKFALDKALEMPEGRIYLVPVRFEGCEVPFSLSRYQWVDLFEQNGFPKLMKSLKARASQLERSVVEVTAPDESPPNLASAPERGSSAAVNKDHAAPDGAGQENEREIKVKALESQAIQYELIGDLRNARKVWYEIKKVDSLFPRVDRKIEELERELRPNPLVISSPRKASSRRNAQILIAITGAFATILAAIIGSPVISSLLTRLPEPTITPSPRVVRTPTHPLPSKTPRPTVRPTKAHTKIPSPYPSEIIDGQGVPMRLVPAGEFTMGSAVLYQTPMAIYLEDFYLDKYEVTNSQYRVCVQAGACEPPNHDSSLTRPSYFGNPEYGNYPVVYVDWASAAAYCEWRGAHLPTEAEWEKAARGTTDRRYPWGNGISCDNANFRAWNGIRNVDCVGDTVEVGSYEWGKSIYGIYEMAGNVSEWIVDWYTDQYSVVKTQRAVRGGSFGDGEYSLRSAGRSHSVPTNANFQIGFRCILELP